MSIRRLPSINALQRPQGFDWDAPSDALSRWAEAPFAAADDGAADVITIYEMIGEDWWTGGGFTAAKMAAALKALGPKPATVKINSPGGDVFEGITIYNQLREHPAKITVEVMGYAASAASVIAMAGDDIAMGRGSMLMIHKAWGLVIGNDDDFRAAAELFGKINDSMVEIYAARTGLDSAVVLELLAGKEKAADGTWFTATEAVEKRFADRLIDDAKSESAAAKLPEHIAAKRRVNAALARDGVPRKQRASLLDTMTGSRDAARPAARDAGVDPAAIRQLIETINS